jgi:riboflavin biosynthesis pyrimidine reductase
MQSLTTLFEDRAPHDGLLDSELEQLYGGQIIFPSGKSRDRPYIIANFVTTLDGVTSYHIQGKDTGNEISGKSEIDHVVMGILRSYADAVLWGAHNYMVARRFLSTPEAIWPEGAPHFTKIRQQGNRASSPMAVIVTGNGTIDPLGEIFQNPEQRALVLTTQTGSVRIGDALRDAPNTEVRAIGDSEQVPPAEIARILRADYDVKLLLHEGGPIAFGAFLQAGLIDELFLTIAPQFAGRDAQVQRPALVEGAAFLPTTAPWAHLQSLKQSEDLLFARYTVVGP